MSDRDTVKSGEAKSGVAPLALGEGRERAWPWAVAAGVTAVITLFAGMWAGGLQLDAPYYAFIAKRIAVTGEWLRLFHDWDGGQPYFNKPPVVFWLNAVAMRLLGQEVWVTRIGPAVVYLAAVPLMAAVAARKYGWAVGWSAAAIMVAQREVFANVLELRMDAGMVVGPLIAAMGVLELAEGKGGRVWRGFALVGLGVGVGLMTRGFSAGLTVPMAVAAAVWIPEARRVVLSGRGLLGVMVAAGVVGVVAGPWYVWQYVHSAGVIVQAVRADVLTQHIREDGRGVVFLATFYLRRLPEVYAVWLVPAGLGVMAIWKRRGATGEGGGVTLGAIGGAVDRVAIAFMAVYFFSIHLTSLRAGHYLVPMIPWLSLVAAVGFWSALPAVGRWWGRWGVVVVPVVAGLVVGGSIVSGIVSGKGIVRETAPEMRRLAVRVGERLGEPRRRAGVPPAAEAGPIVFVPAPSGRQEWQRVDLVAFHTGLRTYHVFPAGRVLPARDQDAPAPPRAPRAGDYVVSWSAPSLGLVEAMMVGRGVALREIDKGQRTVVYEVVGGDGREAR